MAKTVLGRGLGSLMGGTPESPTAHATQQSDAHSGRAAAGRGLKTLISGGPGDRNGSEESGMVEVMARRYGQGAWQIPAIWFFATDLLLLGLAWALIFGREVGVGPERMILAGLAVLAGGCISLVPFLRKSREMRKLDSAHAWRMTRVGAGESEVILMMNLLAPMFVGEVQRWPNGKIVVVPVKLDPPGKEDTVEVQRLAMEAAEVFRQLESQRARGLRASLV